MYDWEFWARDKQLIPQGDWDTWIINAGRGFGKTRTGAETVRMWARDFPIIHIVGPTAGDARDVMVEGESGILNISPQYERPTYHASTRKLTWPNGAKAILFSADEPDRLRGPQCYKAWADELAAWRYPDAWDQLSFGLRLGAHPQCIVTTTPRPTKIIKQLIADARTVVTGGSTYENKANLSSSFITSIERKYEGTRLGKQEIYAEVLSDIEGALWSFDIIDIVTSLPDFKRIVIGVDPAITHGPDSDETGIVVAGLSLSDHLYVIEDKTGSYTPNQWAHQIAMLYHKWGADRVIAEGNQGGEMVRSLINNTDPDIKVDIVHATRGKITRAEPIAGLYEQHRVHHFGNMAKLEDQMTSFTGDGKQESPNNLDAMVWALTGLTTLKKQIGFA